MSKVSNPRITLVHYSGQHTKEVEIVKAYSPGFLDFYQWGAIYTINLLKDGQIKGIQSWKIEDLKTAVHIYIKERRNEFGLKELAKTSHRRDDIRALAKWKAAGLIGKTEEIK